MTAAAVQPDLWGDVETPVPVKPHDTTAVLHAVLHDPLPSRQDDRAHIEAAIRAAAREHDGLVHISTVRQHIKREVFPNMLGAVLRPRRVPRSHWRPPSQRWRLRQRTQARTRVPTRGGPVTTHITAKNTETGEGGETTIRNDYVLICDGNTYLAGAQTYANGTVQLTIKRRAGDDQ